MKMTTEELLAQFAKEIKERKNKSTSQYSNEEIDASFERKRMEQERNFSEALERRDFEIQNPY